LRYSLEKVRMNYRKDWNHTIIQESDSESELLKIAKKTKIKIGKTFEEKLILNHFDEYGDIYHVDALKYFGYNSRDSLNPIIVDALKDYRFEAVKDE